MQSLNNNISIDGISVVTPTHGRNEMIVSLLKSLKTASEKVDLPCEFLIIDSSENADSAFIKNICLEQGAVYVRHEVNNVRQKRNLGIEKAKYSVVLFIDSDCVAEPDLIKEHLETYENGVGGVIGLTKFVGESSRVWRLIEKTSVLDSFLYAQKQEFAPWGPTCNISYRKDILEQIGKFDTSFPFRLGGDDVDLGLRVTDSGNRIKCNSKAVVEHDKETWSSLTLIGKRLFRWGRMHHHLILKHNDRQMMDLPKTMSLFFLLFLVSLPMILMTKTLLFLFLPLIWFFLELFIESLLTIRQSKLDLKDLAYSWGGRMLSLIFEAGIIFESLKTGKIKSFYTEIYYFPPSPNSPGRNKRLIQIWANFIALIGLIFLAVWF
ncbi:MAG TPA: glycosyltransferase [Pyrinomonadaceae bacterium]|nr:glycosyltransferase [Pyrinomonadaceae bacterium]